MKVYMIIIAALIGYTGAAQAKKGKTVECRVVMEAADPSIVAVGPNTKDPLIVDVSSGSAQSSVAVVLENNYYKADLNFQTQISNWSPELKSFHVDMHITNLKGELVVSKTYTSDNIRTSYLKNQLLNEEMAIVIEAEQSHLMRKALIESKDDEITDLVAKRQWDPAVKMALSKDLVKANQLNYVTLQCSYEN